MANERNLRLTALKDDMVDYIKTSRDYHTDVREIRRGIHVFEDMPHRPAIAYWCFRDEAEGDFANQDFRWLHVLIYGYADSDGYGDVDLIHDLASDVEYFLFNDYTYTDDVLVGDFIIYEGGVQDPACMFELEIRIRYENTTNTR